MKNIAIVIGVANYINLQELPGSKNDAQNIYTILVLSNKYEEILFINQDESSQEAKELIIEFIEKYKLEKIEELFFYFSGHGEYFNEDFYYLLIDFQEGKRKQTSIQNTLLDEWIRAVNPINTIKIVDACQSGTQYIKDNSTIDRYLKGTRNQFKKCYFLFSSQQNQNSFATKYISDFTNSFINALKNHSTNEIRYTNIIDFISDEFSSNTEQKPYFIVQGEYTEKFCTLNKDLNDFLNKYPGKIPGKDLSHTNSEITVLTTLIQKDAEDYCTENEALEILNYIKMRVDSFILGSEIETLFQIKIDYLNSYDNVVEIDTVAKFLNKNENNYFINIKFETVIVEEIVPIYKPFRGLYAATLELRSGQTEWETQTKEITSPAYFELTFMPPYHSINIDLIPDLPNLPTYNATIIFVISKKHIRFFSYISTYIEHSWNSKSLNSEVEWKTEEFLLKDKSKLSEFCRSINERLNSFVISNLKEIFEQKREEIITEEIDTKEVIDQNTKLIESASE